MDRLSELAGKLGIRIHSFALGTTIALGAVLLSQASQSCVISGQ